MSSITYFQMWHGYRTAGFCKTKTFFALGSICNLVATSRTRNLNTEISSHSKIVNDCHVTKSTQSNNFFEDTFNNFEESRCLNQ